MMTKRTTTSTQHQKLQLQPLVLFVACIVLVRFVWYEWRPWHVLSLKREAAIWTVVCMLYRYAFSTTSLWRYYYNNNDDYAPSLLLARKYETSWALIQEDYVDAFSKALFVRQSEQEQPSQGGLQIATLQMSESPTDSRKDKNDEYKNGGNDDKNDDKDRGDNSSGSKTTAVSTIHTIVKPSQLPTWLGMQQWNHGGVGIVVLSSSTIYKLSDNGDDNGDGSDDETAMMIAQSIQQHLTFRSLGCSIVVMTEDDDDKTPRSRPEWNIANPEVHTNRKRMIDWVEIPHDYLQSPPRSTVRSSSNNSRNHDDSTSTSSTAVVVAQAAIHHALLRHHETKRLRWYHVWMQQCKNWLHGMMLVSAVSGPMLGQRQ